MKIYINGPVTGTGDYKTRFARAEQALRAEGHEVINPARITAGMPEDTTHREYMKMALCLLDMCDVVFMLEGWGTSAGCNEVAAYALEHKIRITYEGGR